MRNGLLEVAAVQGIDGQQFQHGRMVGLFGQHAIDDRSRRRRHLAAVRPVPGLGPCNIDLRYRSRHILERRKRVGGTLVVLQLHSQVTQHEPGVDILALPGHTTVEGTCQCAHLDPVVATHDLRCPREHRGIRLAPDGIEANRDHEHRHRADDKGEQRDTTGGFGVGRAGLRRLVEVVQGEFLLKGGTLVRVEILGVGFAGEFAAAIRKQRGRGVRLPGASGPAGDGHDTGHREHAQCAGGEIDLHHVVSRSSRLALSRSSDAVSLAALRRATRIKT